MAFESGRTGKGDIPLTQKTEKEPISRRFSLRGQSVRDVMTRNPQTVNENDSLQHVAQLMVQHDCGALPVVQNNKVIGIVTDRDIVVRVLANGRNPLEAKVSDAMTSGAQSVHESDSLDQVMEIMSEHQVRRVPVLDDQDRVVGIIAQADIATEARDEDKVAKTVEEISEKSHAPQR